MLEPQLVKPQTFIIRKFSFSGYLEAGKPDSSLNIG